MKNWKELLQNTSKDFKNTIKKFPVTLILVVFTTIVCCISIGQGYKLQQTFSKIISFCILTGIGTLFVESYFNQNAKKIIGMAVAAIIAVGFQSVFYAENSLWGISAEILKDSATRILIGYILIILLAVMHQFLKNSKLSFQEYMLKLFSNIFNTSIIYMILNIGLILLAVVFTELILEGKYGNILLYIPIMLLGFFYVPAMLNSIYSVEKKEVSAFIKGLVCYVLLPLVTIAIGIIYLYIAKIFIFQDMPSNIIFRILAGIFIIAFPIWNMAETYKKENGIINTLIKILPYSYMPFILLEIYSVGVRIGEFGITPLRYICCVFIVFQIIALALTIYRKKQKIQYLFGAAILLVVITFLSPWNLQTISAKNQRNIILKIMPEGKMFNTLSETEKVKLKGAYQYLKTQAQGEKYIPDYLRKEIPEGMKDSNIDSFDKVEYISYQIEKTKIDIKGYSTITEIYVKDNIEDSSKVDLYNKSEKIKTVNLQEYIEKIKQEQNVSKTNFYQFMENNHVLEIDPNTSLYISDISLTYNKKSNQILHLYLTGFILEKE